MTGGRPRIVFMGSPEFAVPSLRTLAGAGYEIVAVVTQPDRPSGRGGRVAAPPVKMAAIDLGLSVQQPTTFKDDDAVRALAELRPDVIVVAAYGKILPRRVLDIATRGCVNVHASLLPRWRGASPIASAILAGDAETGVTIMEMALKMDAGPVIHERREAIRAGDTTGVLEARLAGLGAEALVETLPRWLDGALPATPQDEAAATYCTLIRKEDGHLRAHMSVDEAERAVRAYNPWPAAYVSYRGEPLRIWRAGIALRNCAEGTGTMLPVERVPCIAFRGGLLALEEVQRPGGRRITGAELLNGERGGLPGSVGLA